MNFTHLIAFPPRGFAKNKNVTLDFDNLLGILNGLNAGTNTWDKVYIGTAATTTGVLGFYHASNSNLMSISPESISGARSYTIPDAGTTAKFVLNQGNYSIGGVWTFSNAVTITPTTNQLVLGTTRTVTLTAPTPASTSRVVTIPDLSGDYSVVGTIGTQTIAGSKTFSSPVLIPDGAVNATGIAFSSETGTGLYRIGAADLGISVNGTLYLEFVSSTVLSKFDLYTQRSSTGTVVLQCENTNNANAAAHSKITATVGGTSAGDPYINFHIPSGSDWSVGGDNSASDAFKVSQSSGLGTNDYLTISTAGAVTLAGALAMGTNKITGLSNGTTSTDAAAFGQIKVLQVQFATNSTAFTTTSSTYQTTNLSVSITPTSSSNRILVMAVGMVRSNATQTANALVSIFRDSTDTQSAKTISGLQSATVTGNNIVPASLLVVDSPASTSAITYSVKLKNDDNATTVGFGNGNYTSIVAIEVV